MKTSTQAFEMIKVINLYSWEDFFLEKIKTEREEELKFFKKIQLISSMIESIFWATSPIMSFENENIDNNENMENNQNDNIEDKKRKKIMRREMEKKIR